MEFPNTSFASWLLKCYWHTIPICLLSLQKKMNQGINLMKLGGLSLMGNEFS